MLVSFGLFVGTQTCHVRFQFAGVSAWRLCWPALHLVNRRMWDWRCWTALTGQLVQSPKVSCAKWKGHVSHSCYASFLVSVHQALRRSPLGMVERDTSEEGRCVSWLDAARKCQWFHCFQLCHVVPNSGKLCLDSVSFSTCMSTPEGIPRVYTRRHPPVLGWQRQAREAFSLNMRKKIPGGVAQMLSGVQVCSSGTEVWPFGRNHQ